MFHNFIRKSMVIKLWYKQKQPECLATYCETPISMTIFLNLGQKSKDLVPFWAFWFKTKKLNDFRGSSKICHLTCIR